MSETQKNNDDSDLELKKLQEKYQDLLSSLENHKRNEKIIKEELSYYRVLAENIKDVIWTLDPETLYFNYVSPSVFTLRGFTPEEIIAQPMAQALSAKSTAYVISRLNDLNAKYHAGIITQDDFFTEEIEQVCKDGTTVWTEVIASYVKNPITNKPEIRGVSRDITQRKRSEELNKEIESKFEAVFHASPIAFVIYAMNGSMLEVNQAYCNLTGYSQEELIGKTSLNLNLLDAGQRENMLQQIKNNRGVLENFELEMLKKDGNKVNLLVSSKIININGIQHRLGINVDITDRKNIEKELVTNQANLKSQNEEYLAINEELQEKNEEYLSLNEEYIEQNEELFKAKEKAEQSDRLKTAFLQNISHEIRTPMNAIMGFSELLNKQFNKREKLEYYSQIINQRCFDLLNIIDDILDVAKIESGQLPVHIEECKLDVLFSEIELFFQEYEKRQNKQHIKFSVKLETNSIILTDKVKLKQILINLIGNAYKYTENGSIETGCNIENNEIVFYIKDSGIGIAEDKKDFIFERFARIEQKSGHAYSGTGLGLSIVKGLLDLLHGKIWFQSAPDKGATFYFSIPFEEATSIHLDQLIQTNDIQYDFSGKNVLIIEDDRYNTEYLKEILEETKIHIVHSFYGNDAFKLLISNHIELVLLDIRLPDTDGYAVARILKSHDPQLKIIAQTAYAGKDDKAKALESGCDAYISKPIKKDQLLSLMKKYL